MRLVLVHRGFVCFSVLMVFLFVGRVFNLTLSERWTLDVMLVFALLMRLSFNFVTIFKLRVNERRISRVWFAQRVESGVCLICADIAHFPVLFLEMTVRKHEVLAGDGGYEGRSLLGFGLIALTLEENFSLVFSIGERARVLIPVSLHYVVWLKATSVKIQVRIGKVRTSLRVRESGLVGWLQFRHTKSKSTVDRWRNLGDCRLRTMDLWVGISINDRAWFDTCCWKLFSLKCLASVSRIVLSPWWVDDYILCHNAGKLHRVNLTDQQLLRISGGLTLFNAFDV